MTLLAAIKLTVSSLAGMQELLLLPDVGAVISVGCDLQVATSHPICRIMPDPEDWTITPAEMAQVSALVNKTWDADQRVLFHCNKGQNRSPTVALLTLADRYPEEDLAAIKDHVIQNGSAYTVWSEPLIEPHALICPDDHVAANLIKAFVHEDHHGITLKDRFCALEMQQWIAEGRDPHDLKCAWLRPESDVTEPNQLAARQRMKARTAALEAEYGYVG